MKKRKVKSSNSPLKVVIENLDEEFLKREKAMSLYADHIFYGIPTEENYDGKIIKCKPVKE